MFFIKGLVEKQFGEARLGTAAFFFLLPTILSIIFLGFVVGLPIKFVDYGISVVLGALELLVVALVLYVLLLVFKGSEARGKFNSVLATLPVSHLVFSIAGLLSFGLVFVFVPDFFRLLPTLYGKSITTEQMLQLVSGLSLPPESIISLMFFLLVLIVLASIAAGLYVIYKIGDMVKQTSRFSNLVFLVVSMALVITSDFVLRLIVGLFFR